MEIRSITEADLPWVTSMWTRFWGSDCIVVHGTVFTVGQVTGQAAWERDRVLGLITYVIEGEECEIVTFNALEQKRGIGSALLQAAARAARQAGCRRLFLVTTNDNLAALKFYQKRGFRLCAIRLGAVDEARAVKPEIPVLGEDNIPLHDELELEFDLAARLDLERKGGEIR